MLDWHGDVWSTLLDGSRADRKPGIFHTTYKMVPYLADTPVVLLMVSGLLWRQHWQQQLGLVLLVSVIICFLLQLVKPLTDAVPGYFP